MIKLCAPTDEAGDTFETALKNMVENNVYLAEIRGLLDKNVLQLTDSEIDYCNDLLAQHGIEVWSISSPIGKKDFSLPIELFSVLMEKAIHVAKKFRTKNIRVFSFFDHNDDVDEVVKRMQLCVDMAAKEGIEVTLENEKGSYAETRLRTLELLDNVKGLKYVYDSSNFIQVGEPAEETLRDCLPRAKFVHFKDGVHTGDDADICPVGLGEAKIEKLIDMVDRDIIFSLEHHLLFAMPGQDYNEIKDKCMYTYKNVSDAFDDACKNAKNMLEKCGYTEKEMGCFCKN